MAPAKAKPPAEPLTMVCEMLVWLSASTTTLPALALMVVLAVSVPSVVDAPMRAVVVWALTSTPIEPATPTAPPETAPTKEPKLASWSALTVSASLLRVPP